MHANKLKFIFFKKNISNKRGMGLLQVLLVTSLLFIIIYGIISLLMYSAKQQRYQTMIGNVRELQKNLEGLLNNQESWKNTFKAAAPANMSFTCLRTGVPCVKTQNVITEIRDASNLVFVTNLPDWFVPVYPSGGFTERGIKCAGFNGNAGLGNDLCPFSYKIIWEPLCPGNCAAHLDPGFRITARLLYNPSLGFLANGAIQTGDPVSVMSLNAANLTKIPVNPANIVISSADQIADPKTGKYDVVVWRTATTNVPSFRIVTITNGNCSPNFSPGSARRGWSVDNLLGGYDPFFLVKITPTGTRNTIQLANKGTYDCDVAAAGYDVGGFQAQLAFDNGGGAYTSVGSSVSKASDATQSNIEFNTIFTVPNNSSLYQLQQFCENQNSTNDLGLANPSNPIFASVTCKFISH